MKRITATCAAVLLALAAGGVSTVAFASNGGTRVDGSTEQSTMTSLQQIMSEHGKKEKCLLQAALINIQIGRQVAPSSAADGKGAAPKPLRTVLNGMTYDQIIALARTYPPRVAPVCLD